MTRNLLLLALGATLLSSCETTGDPNQGGLFGWSQNKADGRLAAREAHLRDLERENAYQRGRSSALRAEERRANSQY